MYEIGKVYIWQNQVGEMAPLNGTECTVLCPPEEWFCVIKREIVLGQETDTPCPNLGQIYFAEKGDLRLKSPPTGEKAVLSLFDQPVLETA